MLRKSSRVVWISTLLALAVIQVGVDAPSTVWAADSGSKSFGEKLQVTVDRAKVDLKRHRLEVARLRGCGAGPVLSVTASGRSALAGISCP